jgi:Spy/CpxP family protein refolding chaperone
MKALPAPIHLNRWRLTVKDIRTAIAAIALVVGGAVVAAAQQPAQTPSPRAHRGEAGDSTRHFGRRGFGPGALQKQLFKGITLSDAEKTNIKNVHTKYEAQMKSLREQFKPQMQAARQARQRGDTTALKNLWSQTSAQREQAKKLLEAERNDLRVALAPEHRAQFDANVKQLEQRVARRANKEFKAGRRAAGTRPRA